MDMHDGNKQQQEKHFPNISNRTPIRPDICKVIQENGSKCSETKTLAILHEFNDIYRDKIQHIDTTHGDNIEVGNVW